MATHEETVLDLVRKAGVLRPRDLTQHGIPRSALSRLSQRGKITHVARGIYELADSDPTEHIDLMEVCKRVPKGIVCLISALNFHGMTTQMPHEVWLAIDVNGYKPKVKQPPVHIVWFSGAALTFGVASHNLQGVNVQITSPAKTVADCFKYRNKVGLDVAIEALKEYCRDRKGNMGDLWKAAEVCRVARVMRPYLEALT